jgi:hypothetical protein
VTVVGRQSGREIRPYKTEHGDELLFLHSGDNLIKLFFRRPLSCRYISQRS